MLDILDIDVEVETLGSSLTLDTMSTGAFAIFATRFYKVCQCLRIPLKRLSTDCQLSFVFFRVQFFRINSLCELEYTISGASSL